MSYKIETCGQCPFNDSCYFSGLGDKSCDVINKWLEVKMALKNEKLERHAERVEHVALMGSLEELTWSPGFPGIPFYVFPPVDRNENSNKPLRVSEHSLEVKGIFEAFS